MPQRKKVQISKAIKEFHRDATRHLNALKSYFDLPSKATLIIRLNDDENLDVCLTEDTWPEAMAALKRSELRETNCDTELVIR